MATVINNPAPTTERVERVDRDADRGGMGFVIGLIALVLLAILLFAYGLPALRNAGRSTGGSTNISGQGTVNVNPPSGSAEGSVTK